MSKSADSLLQALERSVARSTLNGNDCSLIVASHDTDGLDFTPGEAIRLSEVVAWGHALEERLATLTSAVYELYWLTRHHVCTDGSLRRVRANDPLPAYDKSQQVVDAEALHDALDELFGPAVEEQLDIDWLGIEPTATGLVADD